MNIASREHAAALGPAMLDAWDAAMGGMREPSLSARTVREAPSVPRVEPGTVIASFRVAARPRPWRVSTRKGGRAVNPKFVAWRDEVKRAAALAMAGRPPYAGLFAFHATFRVIRRGPQADGGNIGKGSLDALQGIVIVNDRECRREVVEYDPDSDRDEAVIEVVAL